MNPKANSRSRPIRVAFFIEDNEDSSLILNAIASRCFGFWGGRFSLIIPCEGGKPRPAYNQWLYEYDPDIIYSYIDLDQSTIEELHNLLYPSFIVKHELYSTPPFDERNYRPSLPIDCLEIDTVIPFAAATSHMGLEKNISIIDARGSIADDPFIKFNFGTWQGSTGRGYYPSLKEFGKLETTIADGDLEPRQRYGLEETSLNSVFNLVSEMTTKNLWSTSRLSTISAPRLEINDSEWSNSFNIVVGNSFIDKITFWNARSLYPSWLDKEYVDLYIPEELLNDDLTIAAIGNFITRRNYVKQGGNSNPFATIRSNSIPIERLNELSEKLQESKTWIHYTTKEIGSLDDCTPNDKWFKPHRGLVGNFKWIDDTVNNNELHITPSPPQHLEYAPPSIINFSTGAWATDISIERAKNHSKYSNVTEHWHLPRSLRLLPAFTKGYPIDNLQGQIIMPRVSKGGLITLFSNGSTPVPKLNIPTDEEAISASLLYGRDWWPFRRGSGDNRSEQICTYAPTSENGKYFWATYKMFEGLNFAENILLNKFWIGVFEELGASGKKTDERIKKIEDALNAKLHDQFELGNTIQTKIVAKHALSLIDENRKKTAPSIKWPEIEDKFKVIQENYWQHPNQLSDGDITDAKNHEFCLMIDKVQELCSLGVLFQGYEYKCNSCLHVSWISINDIKQEMKCEVCRHPQPAPINQPWHFRLNEFLREALKIHGILPLFWLLTKLRDSERTSSFYFDGPRDIYFDNYPENDEKPDTDIDLIIISDGVVRMCEVKQSHRQLRKIDNFVTQVKKLNPNIATIAVMSTLTKRKHDELFNELTQKLEGTGIKPEIITLDANPDIKNAPY